MTTPTPSKPTGQKPDPRRYCLHMLRQNPAFDPVGVLAARRKALGIAPAVPLESLKWSTPTAQQRKGAVEQLERIRREFWQMSLESLKAQLEGLDVRRMPELQPAVNRLRLVAACRSEFPRLLAEEGTDRAFFAAFRAAAVLPPAEAGPVKDRFLYSMDDAEKHRIAVKTARRVRDAHPLLYQLDKEWINTVIARKKPNRHVPVMAVQTESFFSGWTPGLGFMIFILIKVLLALAR